MQQDGHQNQQHFQKCQQVHCQMTQDKSSLQARKHSSLQKAPYQRHWKQMQQDGHQNQQHFQKCHQVCLHQAQRLLDQPMYWRQLYLHFLEQKRLMVVVVEG
jgi:hypothetical protein